MTLSVEPMLGLMLLAEEAEEDSFNPILPTLPEVIWSGLFFFALWALMKFVLLPPIIAGRDGRKAKVTAGQDSVSESESKLAQLRAAHEERISAAKAEASSIVDAARAETDAERASAVAQVEDNIAALRATAQSDIDTARVSALSGAKDSVSQLAVGAAAKVLGRNVDASASQPAIDRYLAGRES